MTFEQQLEPINTLILENRLAEAQAALDLLKPSSTVEMRMHGHFRGILLTRSGNFRDGLKVMATTMEAHGENVNLVRDIMVCQYHLQNMGGFRSFLSILELNLSLCEAKLSPRSLMSCELMVGKFLEEEGRLAQAIDYYDRALSHAEASDLAQPRARALVQKARWHGIYLPTADLSGFYRDLISLDLSGFNQDLKLEIQHSLMLVELHLVGADHAWQRVTSLPADTPDIDRRLLVFDFIEGCLSQDLPMSPAVLEMVKQFNELDGFEEFLKYLLEGTLEASIKIQRLALLASQLPWASYLRLLCLSANREMNQGARQEIGRKIRLIVESLDPKSQVLWKQRLRDGLETNEIRVEYASKRRSINVQGRSIDLSKKKFGLQLLEGLSGRPSLTVDEAIDLLWETSFTPEHYHRLRMGVHRLNVLIHKATGLGKIIEVDSQSVRLRPEVKLQRTEEAAESRFLSV